MSKSAAAKVAEARAFALLKAEQAGAEISHRLTPSHIVSHRLTPSTEQAGTEIKAPKGNRAQWHANFTLDEFTFTSRDLCVYQVRLPGACACAGAGHLARDLCICQVR